METTTTETQVLVSTLMLGSTNIDLMKREIHRTLTLMESLLLRTQQHTRAISTNTCLIRGVKGEWGWCVNWDGTIMRGDPVFCFESWTYNKNNDPSDKTHHCIYRTGRDEEYLFGMNSVIATHELLQTLVDSILSLHPDMRERVEPLIRAAALRPE